MPPRKRARGPSSAGPASAVLHLPGFDDERVAVLRSLYEAHECCDAEVVLRDRTFPVSRMSVCAASPFFRATFAGGMREGAEHRVTLDPSLSAESVELLLAYAHAPGGTVETTELDGFVQAADQLGFESLLPVASEQLIASTSSDNVVSRMHLAYRHSLPSVLARAVEVLSECADTVCRSPDFAALPQELMETILSHEQNVADESALYAGALNWRAHDAQRHGAPFDALLEHLRFTELGMPFLINSVMHSEEMLASARAKQLVQEAFNFLAADSARRTALASPRTESRGALDCAKFSESEFITVTKEGRAVKLTCGDCEALAALSSTVIGEPIQSWKVHVRLGSNSLSRAFVGVHHAESMSSVTDLSPPPISLLVHATGFYHFTSPRCTNHTRLEGVARLDEGNSVVAWPGFEDGDTVTMTLDTSGASGTLTMAIPRLGGQEFKVCGLDITRAWRVCLVANMFGDGGGYRVMPMK